MKRSKERGSPREITLGLGDRRLDRESVHVIRDNLENLVELPQRFRKTTARNAGLPMLPKHVSIPWIQSLSLDEVGFTPVPLTLSPRDISERFRNPAAIREKRTGPFKETHRNAVILEAGIVIITLGMQSLTEVGFESERGSGCLPRLSSRRAAVGCKVCVR